LVCCLLLGAAGAARAGDEPASVAVGAGGTSHAAPKAAVSGSFRISEASGEDFLARFQIGAAKWREIVHKAAQQNNLPEEFFSRLLRQESAFNPSSVSRAGALGIAQFMPGTAVSVGLRDPFDAEEAIHASARLIARLRAQFGSLSLAAAAYNAGPKRVAAWRAGQQQLPKETVDYVRAITGESLAPGGALLVSAGTKPALAASSAAPSKRSARKRTRMTNEARLCGATRSCLVLQSY
jgi:hypothetical protein